MRISDWRSDVCSSDLALTPIVVVRAAARSACGRSRPPPQATSGRKSETTIAVRNGRFIGGSLSEMGVATPLDRKSVVEGTSVSDRVDLGVRRHILKKTKHTLRQLQTLNWLIEH